MPSVPGPEARVAGGGVHGAGRIVLGGAALAADHPGRRSASARGASPLALDRHARRHSGSAWTHAPEPMSSSASTHTAACPVYGFHVTQPRSAARPVRPQHLRRHVRLRYGSGWHRENGFLSQRPTGIFCYALGPSHGKGTKYRATAFGPGVTPIVSWVGRARARRRARAHRRAREAAGSAAD